MSLTALSGYWEYATLVEQRQHIAEMSEVKIVQQSWCVYTEYTQQTQHIDGSFLSISMLWAISISLFGTSQ